MYLYHLPGNIHFLIVETISEVEVSNLFYDLRVEPHIWGSHSLLWTMDRKKRLQYPHTPNEAAMDCKRRREELCII
jgi:hypothetical protein